MTFQTLKIPAHFELQPSLDFARQISTLSADIPILGLDFSGWSTSKAHELPLKPFGMLIVSQALRQFKARASQVIIAPTNLPNNDIESYAGHIGFFQSCGIDWGKQPGQAKGSQTYLPMRQYSTSNLHHGSDAEILGRELAEKLTQRTDGGLVKTLAYSFMEIIRNVIEHSQSPDFWTCAQYWPSKGEAEIALLDCGIGLQASLHDNPHIRPLLTNHQEALKYALWPGISGKMYAGKRSNPNDEWENGGYGLYMNYRICNEGGSFFIASGDAGLYREKGEDNHYYGYSLPGVALRLRIRVETLEKYDTVYHKKFLEDARHEAEKLQGGVMPTGATMSQMLREDFPRLEATLKIGNVIRHPKLGAAIVEQIETTKQGGLMLSIRLSDGRVKRVRADEVVIEDTQ
jgi:hypothetical protein